MWPMVAYWVAKDGTETSDWEDGAAYSPEAGWFAVADGASTGSNSRAWAYWLVRSFVSDRDPSVLAPTGLDDWLGRVRGSFDPRSPEFPSSRSPAWVQAAAQRQGAHATLLAGRFHDGRVTVVAVGDTCLFHLRAGVPIDVFPLHDASEFGTQPDLIASEGGGTARRARHYRADFGDDDVLVVASDALAEWLVRRRRSPEIWRLLMRIGQGGVTRLCADLRAARQLKNDDVTLFRARAPEPRGMA